MGRRVDAGQGGQADNLGGQDIGHRAAGIGGPQAEGGDKLLVVGVGRVGELAKLEDVPRDVLELCELAHPADADDEKLVAALRLGSANASGPVAYVLAAQVVRLAALAGIDPPPHTPASASGNTAAKAAKATSKPSEAASVAANVAGDVGPGK